MTQSPEYPDLLWMPPKSWTNANRTSVQLVVIHDTEGSEGINSAEDGAANDQRRTDGTSTHYFHDANSTVHCVRTEDQAHAAKAQGNRRGIHHELCGRANQGAAGWADAVSQGTLRRAARQVARDCKKWKIPARKITANQVAAGIKGICAHADISAAFHESDHTDPGPTFPWSQFLGMVQDEMEGKVEPVAVTDDVKTAILQLFNEASNATDTDPGNDTQEGRNFRRYLDAVIDFGNTAGPLTKAVSDLTALVIQQSSATAADIAAALAPLIQVKDGATPDEVEQRIRKVLGGLDGS